MTPEVGPAVFFIHGAAAGYRTDLVTPFLIEGVRVRGDPAKGIAKNGVK
jgi:hypothetical protein